MQGSETRSQQEQAMIVAFALAIVGAIVLGSIEIANHAHAHAHR
jgi:hypothetical protein